MDDPLLKLGSRTSLGDPLNINCAGPLAGGRAPKIVIRRAKGVAADSMLHFNYGPEGP